MLQELLVKVRELVFDLFSSSDRVLWIVPTQMKACASEASLQNVKIMYPRRSGLEALPLGVLDEVFVELIFL